MLKIIPIALCAILLGGGMAYGATDSLSTLGSSIGGSNGSIEGTMRFQSGTVPAGGPFEVDSIRVYINIVGTPVAGTFDMTGVLYESDYSLIGYSTATSVNWEVTPDGIISLYFADPGPTIYTDTVLLYGAWNATVAAATINMTLSTTGSNSTYSDGDTYAPPPDDPTVPTLLDASSYYNVGVYFHSIATGVKPRRRRILLENQSLVTEALRYFAGVENEITE